MVDRLDCMIIIVASRGWFDYIRCSYTGPRNTVVIILRFSFFVATKDHLSIIDGLSGPGNDRQKVLGGLTKGKLHPFGGF